MKEITVKEIMITLEQYATVHEHASLYEAVLALDKARKHKDTKDPRAVLVVNSENHVVGKISQLDVIHAMEPNYAKITGHRPKASRIGFSNRFLRHIADDFNLWSNPLDEICKKAADVVVKDIMYAPSTEGEYVGEDAPLDQAIHQLIMGQHQSLLVVKNRRITGILRVADVFAEILRRMQACAI